MVPHSMLNGRERRGVEAMVVAVVLLCAGVAGAAQDQPPVQPARPAAPTMHMTEMKSACEVKHEAGDNDVPALTKTLLEARGSNDIVVLRAALDAALRHIDGVQARVARCAGMMHAAAPAAARPKDDTDHKH